MEKVKSRGPCPDSPKRGPPGSSEISSDVPGSRAGLVSDCRGAVQPDFNLDAGAEAIDDGHEAIYGEAAEVGIADAGEVGSGNAGASVCGANRQALPVERPDDLSGEDRLELFNIRALMPQIAEHIAASPHEFQFFAFHRSILSHTPSFEDGWRFLC